MQNIVLQTLYLVGTTAIVGAVLVATLGFTGCSSPEKNKTEWIKYGILISIVLLLILMGMFGKWGILPIALFLAFFGWSELIHSVENKYGRVVLSMLLTALGVLSILSGLWETPISISFGIITTTWIAISLPILIARRPPLMQGFLVTGFGMFLISLPLAVLLALVNFSYEAFIFLVLVVMANDGFSAAFGRLLGRTPLCPEISPNKTWEGAIGGLLSAIVSAYLIQFTILQWYLWQILIISATISIIAQIGDLITSALKREAGIKDFGHVLFATGGVLDKFDGLFFTLPVFYTITILIGG